MAIGDGQPQQAAQQPPQQEPQQAPEKGELLKPLFLIGSQGPSLQRPRAAAVETRGSVRTWTGLSAGVDFLLAILLITGLSISTIVISVFGPTRELVATFAWVLAASFVVNGLLLLEVASCERDSAL